MADRKSVTSSSSEDASEGEAVGALRSSFYEDAEIEDTKAIKDTQQQMSEEDHAVLYEFSVKLKDHFEDFNVAFKSVDPHGSGRVHLQAFQTGVGNRNTLNMRKKQAVKVFNLLYQVGGTDLAIDKDMFEWVWELTDYEQESDEELLTRFAAAMRSEFETMQSFFHSIDTSGQGMIEISEFVFGLRKLQWRDFEARRIFKILDKEANGAGHLSRKEVTELWKHGKERHEHRNEHRNSGAQPTPPNVYINVHKDEYRHEHTDEHRKEHRHEHRDEHRTERETKDEHVEPSKCSNPSSTKTISPRCVQRRWTDGAQATPQECHEAARIAELEAELAKYQARTKELESKLSKETKRMTVPLDETREPNPNRLSIPEESNANSQSSRKSSRVRRTVSSATSYSFSMQRTMSKPTTIATAPIDHSAALKEKRMAKARAKLQKPKMNIKEIRSVNNGGYKIQLESVRQKIKTAAHKIDGVEWKELFDGLKNGTTNDLHEFRLTLNRLFKLTSKDVTEYDIRIFFQSLDMSGGGRLDFDKFLDFVFTVTPEGTLYRPKDRTMRHIQKVAATSEADATQGADKDMVLMRRLLRTYCLQEIAEWRKTYVVPTYHKVPSRLCPVVVRVRPLRGIERSHGEFEVVTVLSRGAIGLHQCLPGVCSKDISMAGAATHFEFFYSQAYGPEYSAENKEQRTREFFELCHTQKKDIFAHDVADNCQANPRYLELFRLPVESTRTSIMETLEDSGLDRESPISWPEFRSSVAKLHERELDAQLHEIFSRCDASGDNLITSNEVTQACKSDTKALELFGLRSDAEDSEISDVLKRIDVGENRPLSWLDFRNMFIPERRGSQLLPEVPRVERFVQDCAWPLFQKLAAGRIATLFVFGHTHSGKSHSLIDIIEFICSLLFDGSNESQDQTETEIGETVALRSFKLNAENCFDLLASNSELRATTANLTVQLDGENGFKVLGATEIRVNSKSKFLRVLRDTIHKFSKPPSGATDPLCRSSSDFALVCRVDLPRTGGSLVLVSCAAPSSTERDASIDALRERLGMRQSREASPPNAGSSVSSLCKGHQEGEAEEDTISAKRLMDVLHESFTEPGAYIAALGCISPAAMDTDRSLLSLSALQTLCTEAHELEVLAGEDVALDMPNPQFIKHDQRHGGRALDKRRTNPQRRYAGGTMEKGSAPQQQSTAAEDQDRKVAALEHAMEELRTAAKRATLHFLQLNQKGDWHHMMNEFRELRADKFKKNHPLYSTLEAHFDEPEVQKQHQSLFAAFSGGEHFLTKKQLNLIFANFHSKCAILKKDEEIPFTAPASPEEAYGCLASSIEQPLTQTMFLSILGLFWLVWLQAGIIRGRGDGSTQAEEGDQIAEYKIDYHVEGRNGRVVCRATYVYGNFERLHRAPGALRLGRYKS